MRLVHGLSGGILCGGALLVLAPAARGAEAELITRGVVDAVTVYRGQALVTRAVEVTGPAGLKEVVVTELPDRVLSGSIFAEATPGVEVRSVRYRTRPVSQDVRKEIRELDAQIKATQGLLAKNERMNALLQEQKAYLLKLEAFSAPTATVEMTKGVLNAETVKQVTVFMFEERRKVAEEELKLKAEQLDLKEKLELLDRQRSNIAGSSDRTVQEAVVFVKLDDAKGGKLNLRYLVDSANWAPSYNVRTDVMRQNAQIEYNASIEQMSGEDWTNVSMTLSTATPSLVARAPTLSPLVLSLHHSTPALAQMRSGSYAQQREALQGQLKSVENKRAQNNDNFNGVQQQGANVANAMNASNGIAQGFIGNNVQFDDDLNRVASDLQVLDLVTDAKIDNKPGARRKTEEGVSVTYQLDNRTTLPSRSDRQLIQIASMKMKADFYKVAVPVLTNFVYEEANIVNSGKLVLLAGPASAFVSGQFVGHGEIPTVSAGEKFTLGFGIDTSLRASRELVSRNETVQGGNRVVTFVYRLALENFEAKPAHVRLVDRLPNGEQSQVKVTLAASGPDLSKDEAYLAAERKKGILRYDLQVPGEAIDAKATSIEYSFQVEYDKQMVIADLKR